MNMKNENFSLQDLTNRLSKITFSDKLELDGIYKLDTEQTYIDNDNVDEIVEYLDKWYKCDITDSNIKKYKIDKYKWCFEDIFGGIRILKLKPDTCEIELYSNGKGKLNQIYWILVEK